MLVTEKLVYIHIPKTAGHFAKYQIKRFAGKVLYEGEWHGPLDRLPKEFAHLPVVSFVRNPWDWYVSWFFHQKDIGFVNPLVGAAAERGYVEFAPAMRFIMKSTRMGTKENKLLLKYVNSEKYKKLIAAKELVEPGLADLNQAMVDSLIKEKIGMLTWRYQFLLGDDSAQRCIVGRYENLSSDLLMIFSQLGVNLGEPERLDVLGGKAMNQGASRLNRRYQSVYDRALVNLVANRESTMIRKFKYEFE